jgi:hypothetical protein
MGEVRAPALECLRCHAIEVEEGLARTVEERDSVRQAIALRKAVFETVSTPEESGVFEVRPVSHVSHSKAPSFDPRRRSSSG